MTPERFSSLIELFSSRRIGIIGDFFLDKYLEVDHSIAELSRETGKIAHQVVKIRCSPGAAGNIVNNLSWLGAGALYAIGYTGDDGEGYDLEIKLKSLGCNTEGLLKTKRRMTPTYLKPRNMHVHELEGEHERYDTKNRIKTPPDVEKKIIESLDSILPELDALIIADQVEEVDCGVITEKIRNILSKRALDYPDVVFFADSRAHILLFRNIIIKPNQFELMGIEKPSGDDKIDLETLKNALKSLRNKINAPVFVTRGAKGILVSDPEPSETRSVKVSGPLDITGAGDSAAAGIVLALSSGATFPEAALVGNFVASITVRQLATCGTCRPEQLLPTLEMWLAQG